MPRKLQPDRHAVVRTCAKCSWRDETIVPLEPFTPPPAIAELEQAEWTCANGCGEAHSITVEKLKPEWLKGFAHHRRT